MTEISLMWVRVLSIRGQTKQSQITPFAMAAKDSWVINMMSNTMWVCTAGPDSIEGFAGAMKALVIVFVMTGGNPYGITEVMATYMSKKAYRIGEYGYANGIALLILLFTGILTSLFRWMTRNQEEVRY